MEENRETATPGKNWFYIISPCIIAGALALLAIIDSYLDMENSGGWSFLGVLIAVPFLAFVIVADLIIKSVVKKKVLYVWIVEGTIITAIIFAIKYYLG